ncbi:MAG: GH1 family beta-glucosidase [Pseudomonadota bacterium]
MTDIQFRKDFIWGVATSAYQIEGAVSADERGLSIWDTFCRVPGAIADGSNGDVACDHYHRFEEDLDLVAQLGVPAYRFSIAWPRIQPNGKGPYNAKGFDFYDRLIDSLLKRNITPFLTLYHWDLPQTLQDLGGWVNRDVAYYFADYAAAIAQRFGDRVSFIATHNEPWIVATLGYDRGIFAPGFKDRKQAAHASHHLLLSHGLAVHAMRASANNLQCGIVLNQAPVHPRTNSAEDLGSMKYEDDTFVRWYMDPLFKGEYPAETLHHLGDDAPLVMPGDFDTITTPLDFLGINYYSRIVAGNGEPPEQKMGALGYTDMGWEVYPEGLTELALRLKRDYSNLPPLFITENGAAFPDVVDGDHVHDIKRTEYLQLHIRAVADAIAAGVDIRGYFVWSFLDNFEWAFGYTKRFGIVHVDYSTQKRLLKDSAKWYRDFIASQRG